MKKTMKKAIPVELTLSISAMIIAIASIAVSVWEGYTMRQHYHLSISPKLDWSFSSTMNQAGFVIANKGLGPAIITSRHIYIDGENIDESQKKFPYIIAEALELNNKMQFSSHTLSNKTVIDEGEDIYLFVLHKNNNELFQQKKDELQNRVVFEINYESLYGEKYNITIDSR